MKKQLILTSLVLSIFLTACSEKDSSDDGASQVKSEKGSETTSESKKSSDTKSEEKVTTEGKSTADKSTTEKSTTKAGSKTTEAVDIMTPEFRQEYMFNDHRFQVDQIKFGMKRSEVEAIYGQSAGEGKDYEGNPTELYGSYAVKYDTADKVQQILINSDKKISKEEFIALYGEPKDVSPYHDTEMSYNSNDDNGYKILVKFDDNDQFVAMTQVNDSKGMRGSDGDMKISVDQMNSISEEFKDYMKNYGEKNHFAVSYQYFVHGAGAREDFYANTTDGMMLMQSMLNPGSSVYDIKLVAGSVVFTAKDGKTGEHEGADNAAVYERGATKFIKPGTTATVYLVADNGKVYEYQTTDANKISNYFGMRTISWGFDTERVPTLKETTNEEIKNKGAELVQANS